MIMLPESDGSLLVRVDFSDDDAWADLIERVGTANDDGFRAYVTTVDDRRFAGADWKSLKEVVPPNENGASVLFAADHLSMSDSDRPILCIDLLVGRPPFYCVASELWIVENNLNIANMDWEEFAAGSDGVFRGY